RHGRRPQGADSRRPAGLPRGSARRRSGIARPEGGRAPAARGVPRPARAVRRAVDPARRAGAPARRRGPLPRHRDSAAHSRRARRGGRVEPDGLAQRDRQPVYLHDHAVPEKPARDHGAGGGARGDRRWNPERCAEARQRMSGSRQRCASCGHGLSQLLLKHEGHNPTGSFKDRGMTVAVTQARRVGAPALACASTGNTGAALAAYASLAGLPALVMVPRGQVALGKLTQTLAYGARTLLVRGNFDDCLELAEQARAKLGLYLVNSINPFRIEGQKTIVLELLQQLDWSPPEWIVLPAGNLGNTAAFGKALGEARDWGLITGVPRLAAVQAAGAAPFAASFREGFARRHRVDPHTAATAINIGNPASYERAVRAIRETNGVVTAVSD